jgi:amidophosphoribosyltransferase
LLVTWLDIFAFKTETMKYESENMPFDSLHEECGVFGVYGVDAAPELVYYGLHALQHRGQEACGIVSMSDEGLCSVKGEGLVTEVFNGDNLQVLHGKMAIGHVRYSTAGGGGRENVQPFVFHHHTGNFALAHNGNLVNSSELVRYLEDKGSLFHSTSDSEILAHLIKKEHSSEHRIFAIIDALNMLEGGFAFLIMTENRIYACRDKYGLRPLSIGRLNGGWVISSETCALDIVGAEFVRDVNPGEIVTIDHNGLRSRDYSMYKRNCMCAMEYIYFARPDSDIECCNVHAFRKETGRLLYQESPADADVVIGVPDSSLSAAIGFAEASGIPYEMGLIKNRYIGRTFIQPSQAMREKGVKMKLSAVRSLVSGKRVALIDDSIVRGTTSLRIVRLLRAAGAKEIHVRIASPKMTHPCFYGIDTATFDQLIGSRCSVDEIRKTIEADTLAFLSERALLQAGNRKEMCMACFTGHYPTALYEHTAEIKNNKAKKQ